METITKSPANSLKGWTLKAWFLGNWKTIKEMLKLIIPAAIGWATTNDPEMVGLITIVGKFIIDVGTYYFKSYN